MQFYSLCVPRVDMDPQNFYLAHLLLGESMFVNNKQQNLLLGDQFFAGGDYNAKRIRWESRLSLSKGKQFSEAMDDNIDLSSGHPTYWLTDRKKILDLLDFCFTKDIPRQYMQAEICYDLLSDHSPVDYAQFKHS